MLSWQESDTRFLDQLRSGPVVAAQFKPGQESPFLLKGLVIWGHWGLLALMLGFPILTSALQFTPDWDTLVIHLPQALILTGQTTF